MINLPNWLNRFRKPSGGGGGGGGSGFTLVAHTGASGSSGDTTTGAINTTGANLLVAVVTGGGLSHPTFIDNKGNTWTARVDWFSSHISIFECIPSSVGSGHTFTSQTATGCNIQVMAFTKAGGTPSFDSASSGTTTGNWGSSTLNAGSITPSSANDLFVTGIGFDVGTGAGDSADSGYTVLDTPQKNASNGIGGDAAYFIASGSSSAKNPGWTRGTANNSDAWTIQATWQ